MNDLGVNADAYTRMVMRAWGFGPTSKGSSLWRKVLAMIGWPWFPPHPADPGNPGTITPDPVQTIVVPSIPTDVLGVSFPNIWMSLNATDLAQTLTANGSNATMIEFLGPGKDSGYDNPDSLFSALASFYGAMSRRGIVTCINIVNWNKGEGHAINGTHSICDSRYSDAWFQVICDRIIRIVSDFDARFASIQAVSEWGPDSRNKKCWQKAERWCNYLASKWSGSKGWNQGSRPKTAKSGHYVEYHPQHDNTTGPKKCLILTDCGTVITEMMDMNRLKKYAKKCHAAGSGFIDYRFNDKAINLDAIRAVGSAK